MHFSLLVFSIISALEAKGPAVVIPLDKQYVPVKRNDQIVSHKTAYFGRIFVGMPEPQNFTVVFDTGSGHFFLPSSSCKSATCLKHKRYDSSSSDSAVEINHDGQELTDSAEERDQVAISFGTGEVTGEFVHETLCLTEHVGISSVESSLPSDCTRVRVIKATKMTEEPFNSFQFDGVMGLGLETLALDPQFSVFQQLVQKGQQDFEPCFGYFLSDNDAVPSEISFGGHDTRRLASDLQWSPVYKPELGFWQVKVLSVSVGDEKLAVCQDGSCVAIADTGTSLLGVPRKAAQRLHWLLARKVPNDPQELDCRDFPGPDIVFELEGGVTLSLGAKDYSRPAAMKIMNSQKNQAQVVCRASLLPIDISHSMGSNTFILGEPVLRKYYTAYDWKKRQVGFALAQPPKIQDDALTVHAASHQVYGAPSEIKPAPSMVHV